MKPTATDEPERTIPATAAHRTGSQQETGPVDSGGRLYRYVAELDVAQAIAKGIYRFYDLTKYIKMEDEHGRSDDAEGSVTFLEEEYESNPEKLPVGSFGGVEFRCISLGVEDEYISQYFVFCMCSEMSESVLGDSRYRVDIHPDQFELLSGLLNSSDSPYIDGDGRKTFGHGPVEYYDIDNHPTPIPNERWKEVFVKHRRFMHQNEYRAALFISDRMFRKVCNESGVIQRTIYHRDGRKMDFELEFQVRAGRDTDGWRYIEIDTSEFADKLNVEPGNIVELE